MPYDVVIVIGSKSDLDTIRQSEMLQVLTRSGVSWEVSVVSAHRNATDLKDYVIKRHCEGTKVFIGIAGMSAALPGTLAGILYGRRSVVFGVALSSEVLDGTDALFSQVRMPAGCPVAVCGMSRSGCYNAALAAAAIVAFNNQEVDRRLADFLQANRKPPIFGLLASDKPEES